MTGWAEISECGSYRYSLTRIIDPQQSESVIFIMLYPSTADATKDDPTLRKCIAFADRWGYGKLVVVNLFAFRTSKPLQIRTTPEASIINSEHVFNEMSSAGCIVCAWGNRGEMSPSRPQVIREAASARGIPLYHLGLTGLGNPKHPLARGKHHIPYDQELEPWEPEAD